MHELTRKVEEKPSEAKRTIRDAFASSGYDYYAAAEHLGLHHYTLRRLARTLAITEQLTKDRKAAIKRGEKMNETGRPRKPIPGEEAIVKAFTRAGCDRAATSKALDVTEPTLRTWIEKLGIEARLRKIKREHRKGAA